MMGYRKALGWFLVFLLVVYASVVAKLEIPTNNMELLKWVTLFFFGANTLKPAAHGVRELAKAMGK